MKNIAIIGAGISGLSAAHFLKDRYNVTVFEKESTPGGLIRCIRVNGNLYHICGGHVFNSKREDVLNWFWNKFDKGAEFLKAERNSVVFMEDGKTIPYPIENHIFLFDEKIQIAFIEDLIEISRNQGFEPTNFEEFLKHRFGKTLYDIYFKPYNEKVWRRNLQNVPLIWLEGKLPMPTVTEMIFNNFNHVKEKEFVHSSFWYENKNGSQYIANKLAKELDIHYNTEIKEIRREGGGKWIICDQSFDLVVYCGNIKDLPNIIKGVNMDGYKGKIDALEYHGTTSVFCEIDSNPYSWIYQPSLLHQSHRIICTGNFSSTNNVDGKMTGTIEFTDEITEEDIKENLKKIPLHPKYLTHHYNKYTYPIQDADTRNMIQRLKSELNKSSFYFTGRFADWEYYNMDVAIGAAMDLARSL